MVTTKRIVIGIASETVIRQRVLAIARGEYKPKKGEPKIWFTSLNAVSQVLSTANMDLLKLIATKHPETITELSALTSRAGSNLSRTLYTMEKHGLVALVKVGKKVKPIAKATEFDIRMRASA